ncbi:hypothetical protein ElyMa_006831000 [Elysia marginata]|uniref:Uncharacterized protein n=1 Tax=Elysia marginata TaxID=1093978 RepID=A0AAV4J7X0_9GAST|nr:hypothetical protein ElyMa_006831000 [Elysia marginata]
MERKRESHCPMRLLLFPVLWLCLLALAWNEVPKCDATIVDHHDDRFMSDVNLEHYYIMEESALSKADVMLRGDFMGSDDEDKDEEDMASIALNLTNFKK